MFRGPSSSVLISDETIRSSNNTIRIDTKRDDDFLRYDTSSYCLSTNIHNIHMPFMITLQINRGMLTLVSFTNILAIRLS